MPQFAAYPLITQLLAADTILLLEAATGTVSQIEGQDLADSLQALMSSLLQPEAVSTDTTLDSESKFIVGNSGVLITQTLPDATANEGQVIYFYNRGAGDLVVQKAGSDTINAGTSITLAQYESAILVSVGSGLWATIVQP